MYSSNVDYYRATSVSDAIKALQKNKGAKLLAGGHSLIPAMKLRVANPPMLVDIGRLKSLHGIKVSKKEVKIGALTTHAAIAASEELQAACPILVEAATQIADRQVRNRGTIGGSIAHADPAGDWPAAILALDAEIQVTGPSGERWVRCDEFFLGLLMSVLEPDELVTAIKVPVTGNDKTAYLKAAPRSSGFAVVGIAVRLGVNESGNCTHAAVGITGVTDKAYRPQRVEQLLAGRKLDDNAIEAAAGEATRNVEVIEDINGSAEYRKHLTEVYLARAIRTALSR